MASFLSMGQCSVCGSETKLMVGNRPICLRCDEASLEERIRIFKEKAGAQEGGGPEAKPQNRRPV
jgi:hypothetical protein